MRLTPTSDPPDRVSIEVDPNKDHNVSMSTPASIRDKDGQRAILEFALWMRGQVIVYPPAT
jgi:hypothetical protein